MRQPRLDTESWIKTESAGALVAALHPCPTCHQNGAQDRDRCNSIVTPDREVTDCGTPMSLATVGTVREHRGGENNLDHPNRSYKSVPQNSFSNADSEPLSVVGKRP